MRFTDQPGTPFPSRGLRCMCIPLGTPLWRETDEMESEHAIINWRGYRMKVGHGKNLLPSYEKVL